MARETTLTSGDIVDVVTRQLPKILGSKLKSKRSLAKIVDRVRKEEGPKKRKIPVTMSEFDIHEHYELTHIPVSAKQIQTHLELNLEPPVPRRFLNHDDGKYYYFYTYIFENFFSIT